MKSILILAILSVCSLFTSAQEPKPTPRLYADLGPTTTEKIKRSMVEFYNLHCDDGKSDGYIFNYGTARAVKLRRTILLAGINSVGRTCGHDSPRITFVDVVGETKVRTKFWIIPPGAVNPSP